MAPSQEQVPKLGGHKGLLTAAERSALLSVPVQRLPTLTSLRYRAQSVSAWDHSPVNVGPKLYESINIGISDFDNLHDCDRMLTHPLAAFMLAFIWLDQLAHA